MICYKDKTFCGFWMQCQDYILCGRALTQAVEERANKAGLPICQFTDKPDCFKEIKK